MATSGANGHRPRLAVIGAGPIGLEMALNASRRGIDVDLFEKSQSCAGHVESYQFVRLFSPWALNTTPTGLAALKELGVDAPSDPEAFPTGREFIDGYLAPMLKAFKQSPQCRGVHCGTEVIAVGRGFLLKGESIGGGDMCMPSNKPLCKRQRTQTSFRLLVRQGENETFFENFDFVADCTGSYRPDFANWAGAGGVPALGERSLRARGRLHSTIPDILGADQDRFKERRTMILGAGMSAATALRNLRDLAKEHKNTRVLWATRSEGAPFKVIADDVLPQRKALCEMGNSVAAGGEDFIEYVSGAAVMSIEEIAGTKRLRLVLETPSGQRVEEVDEFISCCGYHPDMSIYQELQVHTCYASDGPIKLAATLLGGSGDCLKQVAAGVETLKSPEPGFFILGSKSYGRSSAFLLKIGYEQVNSVLDLVAPSGADQKS
eukprot:TRINITY_DN71324_c0_g1_i1.p1 TRINITY_DN71324_c0_g1~~TRINITY_DN71324_c0_g1_i1.p1  ORF type:complete len:435 (-),score=83.69 TRINITY_DN71324_c0_g1_i1:171-1475(-)